MIDIRSLQPPANGVVAGQRTAWDASFRIA
jgi:hypothetical protein